MKIILDFDPEYIRNTMARERAVIFTIAFEHQGECYPSSGWTDFGAVIVQWWMNALIDLCRGSHEVEFLFMDGSYSLTLQRDEPAGKVKITAERSSITWMVSLDTIISAVTDAAGTITTRLGEINPMDGDRLGVMEMVKRLQDEYARMNALDH